ncbi:hypothetical protein PENTCL1PPCAC_29885, partial [Pristionchus entomophagus]
RSDENDHGENDGDDLDGEYDERRQRPVVHHLLLLVEGELSKVDLRHGVSQHLHFVRCVPEFVDGRCSRAIHHRP